MSDRIGATAGPSDRGLGRGAAAARSSVRDPIPEEINLDDPTGERSSLERQLDAYAIDVRERFLSEKQLSKELANALAELKATYLATVRGMAIAVEAKDEYTGGHLYRVTRYALAILGRIAPEELKDPQYEYGFLLHDIGKLAVPDDVLKKRGSLTDEEWVVMRSHVETGYRILADIPFLAGAREIVLAHHERWDGRGYPLGLGGKLIPLGARVFPIADAFDAMRSDRPYRAARPIDVAVTQIQEGRGTQFWPEGVDAFLSIPVDHLEELRLHVDHPAA